ncbi:MAG TPA: hypothetical protein VIY51_21405 [Xanthobacteraceae bacterium]
MSLLDEQAVNALDIAQASSALATTWAREADPRAACPPAAAEALRRGRGRISLNLACIIRFWPVNAPTMRPGAGR